MQNEHFFMANSPKGQFVARFNQLGLEFFLKDIRQSWQLAHLIVESANAYANVELNVELNNFNWREQDPISKSSLLKPSMTAERHAAGEMHIVIPQKHRKC